MSILLNNSTVFFLFLLGSSSVLCSKIACAENISAQLHADSAESRMDSNQQADIGHSAFSKLESHQVNLNSFFYLVPNTKKYLFTEKRFGFIFSGQSPPLYS